MTPPESAWTQVVTINDKRGVVDRTDQLQGGGYSETIYKQGSVKQQPSCATSNRPATYNRNGMRARRNALHNLLNLILGIYDLRMAMRCYV